MHIKSSYVNNKTKYTHDYEKNNLLINFIYIHILIIYFKFIL